MRTARIFSIAICLFMLFPAGVSGGIVWKEEKSEHFIVNYTVDETFAKEVAYNSEKYYDRIAEDLGYARYSNFWQWENRVRIYIYPDRESYVKAGPYPEWSSGMANYREKAIYTFSDNRDFVNSVLPHEITHLIFRDFVGLENPNIPMWLDEGVAQWEEPEKRKHVQNAVGYLYRHGYIQPLKSFFAADVTKEKDELAVRNYYIQAMALVDFLIERYGTDPFIQFCRNLRDGKDIEESLRFAYPVNIRNIEDLEREWVGYLKKLK